MLLQGERARDDSLRQERFRALFDREFDYVWQSLRRLGVHARDVEDLAQEVFVKVHHRFDNFDPARPVRPWLFAFAYRCASDWRRLARHRVEAGGDPDRSAAPAVPADEALARAQDLDLLYAALQGVEVGRRAVLILHEIDECSMKDVSKALGIPLFTAYSRLRVARQEFTSALRRLQAQRGGR
jgi:RNA polymerase sigma-70 factor (ECF subfamily)